MSPSHFASKPTTPTIQILTSSTPVAFYGGAEVKYAWKMSNRTKNKWYVLYAKSATLKNEWMDSFQRERDRVREDSENGVYIEFKLSSSLRTNRNAWQRR